MDGTGRRRTIGAVAVSVAAHLALVATLLQLRPTLPEPPEAPGASVIQVVLLPRSRLPAAAHSPLRARSPRPLEALQTTPVAPVPVAPSPAAPSSGPAAAPAPGPAAPSPDLAGILRRGAVGCANAGAVGLSRAERETCEERLAAGAKSAPHLWGMEPAKRQYYAAVAEAKAPSGSPTQGQAIGRMGLFDTDMRGMKGHLPGIGCKVYFGRGYKPPNAPPHALKLGPCFIEPPAGSLSPDVDVPLP